MLNRFFKSQNATVQNWTVLFILPIFLAQSIGLANPTPDAIALQHLSNACAAQIGSSTSAHTNPSNLTSRQRALIGVVTGTSVLTAQVNHVQGQDNTVKIRQITPEQKAEQLRADINEAQEAVNTEGFTRASEEAQIKEHILVETDQGLWARWERMGDSIMSFSSIMAPAIVGGLVVTYFFARWRSRVSERKEAAKQNANNPNEPLITTLDQAKHKAQASYQVLQKLHQLTSSTQGVGFATEPSAYKKYTDALSRYTEALHHMILLASTQRMKRDQSFLRGVGSLPHRFKKKIQQIADARTTLEEAQRIAQDKDTSKETITPAMIDVLTVIKTQKLDLNRMVNEETMVRERFEKVRTSKQGSQQPQFPKKLKELYQLSTDHPHVKQVMGDLPSHMWKTQFELVREHLLKKTGKLPSEFQEVCPPANFLAAYHLIQSLVSKSTDSTALVTTGDTVTPEAKTDALDQLLKVVEENLQDPKMGPDIEKGYQQLKLALEELNSSEEAFVTTANRAHPDLKLRAKPMTLPDEFKQAGTWMDSLRNWASRPVRNYAHNNSGRVWYNPMRLTSRKHPTPATGDPQTFGKPRHQKIINQMLDEYIVELRKMGIFVGSLPKQALFGVLKTLVQETPDSGFGFSPNTQNMSQGDQYKYNALRRLFIKMQGFFSEAHHPRVAAITRTTKRYIPGITVATLLASLMMWGLVLYDKEKLDPLEEKVRSPLSDEIIHNTGLDLAESGIQVIDPGDIVRAYQSTLYRWNTLAQAQLEAQSKTGLPYIAPDKSDITTLSDDAAQELVRIQREVQEKFPLTPGLSDVDRAKEAIQRQQQISDRFLERLVPFVIKYVLDDSDKGRISLEQARSIAEEIRNKTTDEPLQYILKQQQEEANKIREEQRKQREKALQNNSTYGPAVKAGIDGLDL